MSVIKKDIGSPDKYDIFIQKIDHFQSLVEEKKKLQIKIAETQKEFQEKIKPLEDELNAVIKKLETNLAKLEGAAPQENAPSKFGRGQLGTAIKNLLRSHPNKTFKPRDIGDALNIKGTTVSLWFNKYGSTDPEIERVPSGKDGKRFVYTIK
ncbi:MAG: hypothetical protein HGA62_04540 [Chlorobiaceae bacterium]|nr:hypothetical protein [Chlorobiaceae bacterium]NTV60172.1 hypothetical protein [Chlorobiaceae bacterium]